MKRKIPSYKKPLISFLAILFLVLPAIIQYLTSPPTVRGVSSTIVISQVYGGAGCGTANCSTYKNDYIELFNRGNSAVSLNGWSVQYAAATGTTWQVTNLTNVTLQPGQYYLVAESFNTNGINTLPTPDVTGSIAMSATAGKVALVNTTTALSGACPTGASIIDLVGYGSTANCNEGGANAPAPSTTTADVRAMSGCTDTDNNGSDFAATTLVPRNTATALNPCNGGGTPNLSINDVSLAEGNSGTTTFTFTVTLSSAAQAGGVTFNIATQDGTAMTADNDYVAQSLTSQTIAQGNTTYTLNVTVNGDTTNEPNETFFVNVTNVSGANLTDGQGLGTITNDDVTITAINQIQGSGSTSPFAGQSVTTTGIVVGLRSNGFYIQTPDANVDADLNTSEGMFVFTSSAPPAAVIGNAVQVTGTVSEFRSTSADIHSATSTEMTSPTVVLLSTGNPLPTASLITATDTDPAGSLEQLEKYEHMRIRINSLTVVAPTDGVKTETAATSASNGVFWGVVMGVARPFREPGIEAPNALPSGSGVTIPPVPRFDANPEHIRIDSNGQPGTSPIDVTTDATITNLVGVFDPGGFPNYTLYPELATVPTVTGNVTFTPVPIPDATEFTVASFNLERFYDDIDDPGGDVVLTTTAFNNRLNKASLAIRNVLRTPDILGVEEMEDLKTLQALANKINSDAVAAGDPNPNYQPYLVEGNDIGLIDVGFLVKSTRVTVIDVTQFGKTTTYINPNNGASEILNDRPPLVLRATVSASPQPFPLTVIVNHLRSLNNVDDETADGTGTVGARVRAKRRAQAEYLANLIQTRQVADPTERIISIGDYNAFQFNDGLGDSIGTIKGTPTPADQVVLASPDLVNPDLVDLIELSSTPAEQKYSFSFDGNAQALDHELVNQPLMTYFSRFAYARVNGDFPEVYRTNANRPERISDHDAAVAYFLLEAPTLAKLSNFEALSQGDEVLLQWHTGEEVNNLGFNVYKEERGIRRRLTPQIVAGSALVAGAETMLAAGRSYSWWDNFTNIGAQYWLEEIDLNGNSVWHGPVRIKLADRISNSRQRQATLLNMMGREQVQEGVTLPLDVKAEPSSATPTNDGAYQLAAIQPSIDLAGRAAIKIAVKRTGLYRLTQPELLAAGMSPSVQAQKLQLFVDGKEIPISISGKSAGQFDASSAIEFYGTELDSPVTEAHTYWLVWGDAIGKRIQKVKGDSKPGTATSYPYTVERCDRTLYFASLRNGDKENFFGAIVSRTPVDQTMTLQHLDLKSAGQATIEVALQGVTQVAHRVNVMINGAVVGEVRFDKQAEGIERFPLSQSQLREGANQVTLVSQNGDSDVSLVDYVRLTYNHSYTADSDALTLTATGKQQITVGGFSNNTIRVFDVTNPSEAVEINGEVVHQQSGYVVTFAPAVDGNRNLLVTTSSAIRRPANIVANLPSALRSASNSADWMIITHSSLFEAAKQLQTYRQSQGLVAKIVDIEDVYDEFAFGNKAPQAIRSFLAYAAQSWQRAPRFVVLMGDSSFDPKDYLGRGDFDLVPTKLIDSSFLETASDEWFADSIANTEARMMVGRLPVRGNDEAMRMVAKIINYEQMPKADSVLLVSDVSDTYNFAAASNRLKEIVTDGSRIEHIDRGSTDAATARRALLDAIKRGQRVVNYTGHGSVDLWRGNLFTATDARSLTNQDHLPLFVMMNCLNGYFQDAATDSLAEALMKAERGGAVAVWASSGLTIPSEQSLMNQQMFHLLFSDDTGRAKFVTLGEITSRAKATVGDADVRNTWILFGDPATRLL